MLKIQEYRQIPPRYASQQFELLPNEIQQPIHDSCSCSPNSVGKALRWCLGYFLYHDCVIQTLRDGFKQSHQQITTDTPYDRAQIGDRYDHPHRRVRSEAAGSNLEKRTFFWRTHPPVATSFADVQYHARPRRDEAVRQRVKGMPIP